MLAAGMAGALIAALVGLPREGAALPAIARDAMRLALPQWHIAEPVNEVVYGTRGFDTFGETFLLLAAVVSVTTLTRRREERRSVSGEAQAGSREQAQDDPRESSGGGEKRARAAERRERSDGPVGSSAPALPDRERLGSRNPERADAMSLVTRTASRAVAPVLAVAGVYLAAEGYSPGGGFPAGVVVLGVILLLYASFGHERIRRAVRPGLLEGLELFGAITIIAIELFGLVLEGSFSANWLPLASSPTTILSGGVLQAFSGSELIEVATGLTLSVFALLAMRHDWTPDEEGR